MDDLRTLCRRVAAGEPPLSPAELDHIANLGRSVGYPPRNNDTPVTYCHRMLSEAWKHLEPVSLSGTDLARQDCNVLLIIAENLDPRDYAAFASASKALYRCLDEGQFGTQDRQMIKDRLRRKRVEVILSRFENDPESGLQFAARIGDHELVDFFSNRGFHDWNDTLYYASLGGHRELVDFFIRLGANNWDGGLRGASRGGHRELVEFFISQGADSWNIGLLNAISGGNRELVDFFISQGAGAWNYALEEASEQGHRDLVDLFIAHGAKYWNWGLAGASRGGHRELVDFFINQGADNIEQASDIARSKGHDELADYLKALTKNRGKKRIKRN